MKIPLIAFGILVCLLGVMIFGSIALSRFVRWMGWPQESLAAVAIIFMFLACLSLSAWRFGIDADRAKQEIKNVNN